MSDAAVTILVAGLVNVVTMVVGFLTLWVKLRYGVEKADSIARKADLVETKLDHNTQVTTQAAEEAARASAHAETCDGQRAKILSSLSDHDKRILSLEGQLAALKVSMDGVSKEITSTRHEMRGHLQTVTNKLDLLGVAKTKETA